MQIDRGKRRERGRVVSRVTESTESRSRRLIDEHAHFRMEVEKIAGIQAENVHERLGLKRESLSHAKVRHAVHNLLAFSPEGFRTLIRLHRTRRRSIFRRETIPPIVNPCKAVCRFASVNLCRTDGKSRRFN